MQLFVALHRISHRTRKYGARGLNTVQVTFAFPAPHHRGYYSSMDESPFLLHGGIADLIARNRQAEQHAQLTTILAVAVAAFCVWLTVRIVNRRERWAKWTLAAAALPVLYVLSFGPACWAVERDLIPLRQTEIAYAPIVFLAWHG